MLITKSNTTLPGIRKRTLNRTFQFGPVSIQFVTLIILAAAALFYLAQSTASATRSYKTRELEQKKVKLMEETERLKIESVRLKSLKELQSSVERLGLEPSP